MEIRSISIKYLAYFNSKGRLYMKKDITEFYNGLKGKTVAFIGAGVSHKKLIEQFCEKGAVVTLCDKKHLQDFGAYKEEITRLDINLSLGDSYLDGLKGQEIIMRTPGFEYFTPELQQAKENGSVITSEMELFFAHCPCKIIAITGSDGKTTTTTLISEMLKAQGFTVHIGGNIGKALLPIVSQINPTDYAVVELSSFQLISMKASPDIAVVTNVTPNHLDHHKDMQEYIDAKRNILIHQAKPCRAVLGYQNDTSRGMQTDIIGDFTWFTRHEKVENGACLNGSGELSLAKCGQLVPVVSQQEILLPGLHNIENLLCAFATLDGLVSVENMRKVATTFTGVEHRIEPVRTLDGVKWFNDSIASSPTRTIAGLKSFDQKIIIIAGGYDKKIPYEPLAPEIINHVKVLVLMGQTGPQIEKAILEHADYAQSGLIILKATDMQDAVIQAKAVAVAGDVISLSPASASFDMYPNFEERGKHFKALVNAL